MASVAEWSTSISVRSSPSTVDERSASATRTSSWSKKMPTATPAVGSSRRRTGGRPRPVWRSPFTCCSTTSPCSWRAATTLPTVVRERLVNLARSLRLACPRRRNASTTSRRLRSRREAMDPPLKPVTEGRGDPLPSRGVCQEVGEIPQAVAPITTQSAQNGTTVRLPCVKTSLGIWALGSMVTRFVPGGYQPERAGETTVQRVRRAVDGLGDLIDGYEFHYPAELNEQNVDEIREALGPDHDIYCLAGGLHLDPRFGRGGFVNPDAELRAEAVRIAVAGAELSGQLGVPMIVWPGIEGYNYPFQTPYEDSWTWFVDGLAAVAGTLKEHGQT